MKFVMEWLILLFLVPAILVPIVLLGGFAGCKFCPSTLVSPPTVTVTPKNVDHIRVHWENTEPSPVGYHFVRKKGAIIDTEFDVNPSITTVEDTGLDANTEYTYEVSVTVVITNCDDEHENVLSDPGTATAKTFRTVLNVGGGGVDQPLPLVPPGSATDYTFVQRIPGGPIPPGQLLAGGSKVGIKVQGAPAGNVTINSIYISRTRAALGTPGINDWDSATDITQVTSTLPLPDDQPIDLEPIDYGLDQTQDLIIAFDFTATPSAAHIRYVPRPGVELYFKAGVKEASMATRTSGYNTQPQSDQRLYLVVTIGVP